MPFGRADVATATDVFEVEPYKRWRDGIRQAFAYGAMTGLTPNLALYGLPLSEFAADALRLDLYLRIRDNAPAVALWFHGETQGWYKVTSRQTAMRIPR